MNLIVDFLVSSTPMSALGLEQLPPLKSRLPHLWRLCSSPRNKNFINYYDGAPPFLGGQGRTKVTVMLEKHLGHSVILVFSAFPPQVNS